MFASVDGANPEYMALVPRILAPRHVLLPSIPENKLSTHPKNRSDKSSSAEAQGRMDGCSPELMAISPSTLR